MSSIRLMASAMLIAMVLAAVVKRIIIYQNVESLSEQDITYNAQMAKKRQKMHEEQLQAYREDLAEWLTGLQSLI